MITNTMCYAQTDKINLRLKDILSASAREDDPLVVIPLSELNELRKLVHFYETTNENLNKSINFYHNFIIEGGPKF